MQAERSQTSALYAVLLSCVRARPSAGRELSDTSAPRPSDSFRIGGPFPPGVRHARDSLAQRPDSSPPRFLPMSTPFPAESPVVPRRPVLSLVCLRPWYFPVLQVSPHIFFWKPCSAFAALPCPLRRMLQHTFQLIFSKEAHYVIKQIVPLLP